MVAPCVLLVENLNQPLKTVPDILLHHGYALERVSDLSLAASDLMKHPEQFDVLLLDYHLENRDIQHFLTQVHSSFDLKTLPLIAMVPNTQKTTLEQALQRGAHYCLSEDFTEEHILSIMEAAVQRHLTYRELLKEGVDRVYPLMRYLVSGEFRIRTLEDAQDLSRALSTICPNPNLAMVGISELLINAIEHGNLNINYAEKSRFKRDNSWETQLQIKLNSPEHRHKTVKVVFSQNLNEIIIDITDQGKGFDAKRYLDLDTERLLDTHGRGILMAKSLVFKSLQYSEKGNQVTCVIDKQGR